MAKLKIRMERRKIDNKILIVANWKMNPETLQEAMVLFKHVAKGVKDIKEVQVVMCPPFVYLNHAKDGPLYRNTKVRPLQIGAQDCFWEYRGAFTGEISPLMLKKLGCEYVILGHSERKNYLKETLDMIEKKIIAALRSSLIPIVCIGEKSRGEQRKKEVESQLRELLGRIEQKDLRKIVLTYEPEWAISSQKGAEPANPEEAERTIFFMREILCDMFGESIAAQIPILYGGSVDHKNIRTFIREGKAQGALVGSASLNAKEFIELVKNAKV